MGAVVIPLMSDVVVIEDVRRVFAVISPRAVSSRASPIPAHNTSPRILGSMPPVPPHHRREINGNLGGRIPGQARPAPAQRGHAAVAPFRHCTRFADPRQTALSLRADVPPPELRCRGKVAGHGDEQDYNSSPTARRPPPNAYLFRAIRQRKPTACRLPICDYHKGRHC